MNNNNAKIVGIAKLVNEKSARFIAARTALSVGNFPIDTMIRVHGSIGVGEDYNVAPTVSVPLKETLALFIAYCGITREAAISTLRRCMVEAITATDGQGAGALLHLDAVRETMERVETDIIARLPKQPRKGPVNAKGLQFEEVLLETA